MFIQMPVPRRPVFRTDRSERYGNPVIEEARSRAVAEYNTADWYLRQDLRLKQRARFARARFLAKQAIDMVMRAEELAERGYRSLAEKAALDAIELVRVSAQLQREALEE